MKMTDGQEPVTAPVTDPSTSSDSVGGVALATYRSSGGALYLTATTWQLLVALALFGLLCLQVGDAVAERWRGKPRGEVFKRKSFPIPIVTKKDK